MQNQAKIAHILMLDFIIHQTYRTYIFLAGL